MKCKQKSLLTALLSAFALLQILFYLIYSNYTSVVTSNYSNYAVKQNIILINEKENHKVKKHFINTQVTFEDENKISTEKKDIISTRKVTRYSSNEDDQIPQKTFMTWPWKGKGYPCFQGYDNRQMSEFYFY